MQTTREMIADLNALERAIETMPERAKASIERVIAAGAAQMLSQRWRIMKAITGQSWWISTEPPGDLLANCRGQIADMITIGRDNDPRFDTNRLIALRQAERALVCIMEMAP